MVGDGAGAGLEDPVAFTALVDREAAAVHAYLARRAPADAEDLLGRVWLEAFTSRTAFDPARGSARSWLFGVARHVLLRHWRERSAADAGAALPAMVFDPWDEVDRRLDSAALAGSLRAALADLPHTDREMLLLIAWEQLTPTEAATVVGIPPGTARTRLHRARARMRAALDTADPDPDHPAAAAAYPTSTGPMIGGPR